MEDSWPKRPDAELPPVIPPQEFLPPPSEVSEQKVAEEDFTVDALDKNFIVGMDKAIKAAEEDRAEEIKRERSHEIKDEFSSPPVQVGSVIADANYARQAQVQDTPTNVPPTPQYVPPVANEPRQEADRPSLYRYAIKVGFISALILIAVFAILQVIF